MYDPTKPYKKQILDLIKQTWETCYVSVKEGVYPIIKKKFSYPEVDHTDGIGTKGVYHWKQRSFENAALDALAMNLNDLALSRAIPYKLQNHIFIPKDDKDAILEIVKALVYESKKRNIAITGGETSIHDNIKGLDISMTVSGFIPKEKPNKFKRGDVLIGLKSSGLHSNGFTKVRKVFGKVWSPEFIKPTKIYLDTILELDEKYDIHGMMHITGGAYTKLKDILGKDTDAVIEKNYELEPHQIFRTLYNQGIPDKEMYTTFNCGTGFILSASPRNAKKIVASVKNAHPIGEIVRGTGKVKIESWFSRKKIEL